ncbi:MAG: hypothetical protein HY470_00040 [Candidatus Ryanbacteria bacterium]|nr:hypothetical protein [Candidatus Ryanbacteria bacterium]
MWHVNFDQDPDGWVWENNIRATADSGTLPPPVGGQPPPPPVGGPGPGTLPEPGPNNNPDLRVTIYNPTRDDTYTASYSPISQIAVDNGGNPIELRWATDRGESGTGRFGLASGNRFGVVNDIPIATQDGVVTRVRVYIKDAAGNETADTLAVTYRRPVLTGCAARGNDYTHELGGCWDGYEFTPNCGVPISPGPSSYPPGCRGSGGGSPPPGPGPIPPPPPVGAGCSGTGWIQGFKVVNGVAEQSSAGGIPVSLRISGGSPQTSRINPYSFVRVPKCQPLVLSVVPPDGHSVEYDFCYGYGTDRACEHGGRVSGNSVNLNIPNDKRYVDLWWYMAPETNARALFDIGENVVLDDGSGSSEINVDVLSGGGAKLGSQPVGAEGTVQGGPRTVSGRTAYPVDFQNNPNGFVPEEYLQKSDSTSPRFSDGSCVEITRDENGASHTVNVRAGAGTNTAKIGTRVSGQKGLVIGSVAVEPNSARRWWNVDFDGTTLEGYVLQRFLKTSTNCAGDDEPIAPPPPPPPQSARPDEFTDSDCVAVRRDEDGQLTRVNVRGGTVASGPGDIVGRRPTGAKGIVRGGPIQKEYPGYGPIWFWYVDFDGAGAGDNGGWAWRGLLEKSTGCSADEQVAGDIGPGKRVEVYKPNDQVGANVRETPGGRILGQRQHRAKGTVFVGSQSQRAAVPTDPNVLRTWWKVDFDDSDIDGWVWERHLRLARDQSPPDDVTLSCTRGSAGIDNEGNVVLTAQGVQNAGGVFFGIVNQNNPTRVRWAAGNNQGEGTHSVTLTALENGTFDVDVRLLRSSAPGARQATCTVIAFTKGDNGISSSLRGAGSSSRPIIVFAIPPTPGITTTRGTYTFSAMIVDSGSDGLNPSTGRWILNPDSADKIEGSLSDTGYGWAAKYNTAGNSPSFDVPLKPGVNKMRFTIRDNDGNTAVANTEVIYNAPSSSAPNGEELADTLRGLQESLNALRGALGE